MKATQTNYWLTKSSGSDLKIFVVKPMKTTNIYMIFLALKSS